MFPKIRAGYAQLTVQGGSETFGAVPYDPTAEGAYEANGWRQAIFQALSLTKAWTAS